MFSRDILLNNNSRNFTLNILSPYFIFLFISELTFFPHEYLKAFILLLKVDFLHVRELSEIEKLFYLSMSMFPFKYRKF